MKNPAGTPNLTQENQAIKRQKLEGGRTRQVNVTNTRSLHNYCCFHDLLSSEYSFVPLSKFQILNVKPQLLPHKSKLGLTSGTSNISSSIASKTIKEDRKVCTLIKSLALYFLNSATEIHLFHT